MSVHDDVQIIWLWGLEYIVLKAPNQGSVSHLTLTLFYANLADTDRVPRCSKMFEMAS